MLEDVALGPRAAHDPARGASTLLAYRAWAERAGSQAQAFIGDPAWPDQRRFDRAFERLSLPGFGRAPRFELLVTLGRLGVFEVRPWSLQLSGDALDPTIVASKRVLGIGDPLLLQRRSGDLATGVGVPIEALDLALANWLRPEDERITAGATVGSEGRCATRSARRSGCRSSAWRLRHCLRLQHHRGEGSSGGATGSGRPPSTLCCLYLAGPGEVSTAPAERPGRAPRTNLARQRRQRPHPRHEQVRAAAGGDERPLRAEEERRVALDGHLARAVGIAHEEVAVVAEVEDVAVVEPLRLDALELARDARVEADEDQAAVDVVVVAASEASGGP